MQRTGSLHGRRARHPPLMSVGLMHCVARLDLDDCGDQVVFCHFGGTAHLSTWESGHTVIRADAQRQNKLNNARHHGRSQITLTVTAAAPSVKRFLVTSKTVSSTSENQQHHARRTLMASPPSARHESVDRTEHERSLSKDIGTAHE